MVLNLTPRLVRLLRRLGLAHGRLLLCHLLALGLLTTAACSDGIGSDCTEIDAGPDGGVIVVCEDEADGGVDDDCAFFCGVEDECGLRTFDDCVASACPDGAWILSVADGCVASAADCGEVAVCSCEARCDNETACFGSRDPACVADCQSLAEQLPNETYLESRCVLESPCEDIALCSG
jgi:hypothetical protein